MSIIACGINHKTAPVALREKIIFALDKLPVYLQDLVANENIQEAVLLSTCNRSELYCNAESAMQLFDWVVQHYQVSREELKKVWYSYQDQEAVEHIMQVACGLDSMVLGEPEILGQMKTAFSEACAAGSVGAQFNRLFQQVFSVAKDIRTNTTIGACPVSIASAAINLAKQVFNQALAEANILLIGAGDTIQLVLRYLQVQPLKSLTVANRNIENAKFAEKYSANVIVFDELPKALIKADIVITATASPTPIVTKGMLSNCVKDLFILDIAVPRDVEETVTALPHVKLYSIDDLKNIIQHNLKGREHAAEKAQQVIKQRSAEFMVWQHSIDQVATTIRAYRKQIEDLCSGELAKSYRQLQQGDDPVQVITAFAYALTNKMLHHPSVQLRQAGVEGRWEILQLARELFAIPETAQ